MLWVPLLFPQTLKDRKVINSPQLPQLLTGRTMIKTNPLDPKDHILTCASG